MKKSLRKDLSASGMYSLIHDHSKTIVDHRRPGIRNILGRVLISTTCALNCAKIHPKSLESFLELDLKGSMNGKISKFRKIFFKTLQLSHRQIG